MQTFSELTKEELYKDENKTSCCDLAELAGMLLLGSTITYDSIRLVTENGDVLARLCDLCAKLGIEIAMRQENDAVARYTVTVSDRDRIRQILNDLELVDSATGVIRYTISPIFTENECCSRAFVKGAFMGGGTVIDPNKNYNLELVTPYLKLSQSLLELLKKSGFMFRTVQRKSKYVLYTKNSEVILDFLTFVGAYRAQMELINIKIEKEIRIDFNRSDNSETANIEKTIEASVKQIQAIKIIDEKIGLDELPEELAILARLRLEHRSTSLNELGMMLNPPLGKSGVNHRFNKIIGIAEKLETKEKP